jgi:thiamine transporter ThiT
MMNSEAIHRSITDADDLEEIIDERITVGDVCLSLVQHPAQIVMRWNWKAALLGAIMRASFYFTIYKASRESWIVTLSAVLVEFIFRFLTSGINGSLIQSFRRATPEWMATVIISVMLPFLSHVVEFVTHYAQENMFPAVFPPAETIARQRAFAVSVLVSVLSALFNLFMMRKGVLLVGAGEETRSFSSDLKSIPMLVVEFIIYLPQQILRAWRDGRAINAIGIFAAFGLTVGTILGTFRGKWQWAWTTALGAWGTLLFATMMVLLVTTIQRRVRESKSVETQEA